MDLETQGTYLKIIEEDFIGMKNMLDHIREKITQYPVYTQLAFIKPLKTMIVEAWCLFVEWNDGNIIRSYLGTYKNTKLYELPSLNYHFTHYTILTKPVK